MVHVGVNSWHMRSTACNGTRWCKLLAHAIHIQFPKPPAPPPSTFPTEPGTQEGFHHRQCKHLSHSLSPHTPSMGFRHFCLCKDECFVVLSLPKFRYDSVGCALLAFSSCLSFYTESVLLTSPCVSWNLSPTP